MFQLLYCWSSVAQWLAMIGVSQYHGLMKTSGIAVKTLQSTILLWHNNNYYCETNYLFSYHFVTTMGNPFHDNMKSICSFDITESLIYLVLVSPNL